ncbi:PilL N-terminal domain-containing protein [Billgrantia lactosivorans]|uniref:PFGI-1 class ICE element type IV pilus protein PilL2 n=1 Tax=Billgrantia lactosivorans TaxID=2185141 RepID=UPI000DAD0C69|nr:PilL N-terminal domain-containing protein [Halomonas lactosivorans]
MVRSIPRFLTCSMAVALLVGCADQLHRSSTEHAEATQVDEASALEIAPRGEPQTVYREQDATTAPNALRTGVVEADGHAHELPTIEVLRTARYQLVSTRAPLGQRQLLEQYVNVRVPSDVSTTVGDGIEYALRNTGYSLCHPNANPQRWLFSRPLPAIHYRLGPMPLREALQVLAGDAWELDVDPVRREVCFEQRGIRAAGTLGVAHSLVGTPGINTAEAGDE